MKIVKNIGILLLLFVIFGVASCFFLSESKPLSNPSKNADIVAQNMMKALNKDAFDSLKYLTWNFGNRHQFVWDKQNNKTQVSWKENKVLLNLSTQKGLAYVNNVKMEGKKATQLLEEAWSHWCNDSFWMVAPFKVFDPGTVRSIVQDENGNEGLMVEYLSGGVTPGDAYLWLLNDKFVPTGYKMWTSILPVKGLYASWSDWSEFCNIWLSQSHKMTGFELKLTDIKVGDHLSEFGLENQLFISI